MEVEVVEVVEEVRAGWNTLCLGKRFVGHSYFLVNELQIRSSVAETCKE